MLHEENNQLKLKVIDLNIINQTFQKTANELLIIKLQRAVFKEEQY